MLYKSSRALDANEASFFASSKDQLECSYKDHAADFVPLEFQIPTSLGTGNLFPHLFNGRGTESAFPVKLHKVLEDAEKQGLDSIVSWQPHGRCFLVKNQSEFVQRILKGPDSRLKQTKFPSFLRQLNLYGFKRISNGRDKGGYYHELFLKGKPFLSYYLQRCRIKGTKVRKPASPDSEPNFYAMPFLTAEQKNENKPKDQPNGGAIHSSINIPLGLLGKISSNRLKPLGRPPPLPYSIACGPLPQKTSWYFHDKLKKDNLPKRSRDDPALPFDGVEPLRVFDADCVPGQENDRVSSFSSKNILAVQQPEERLKHDGLPEDAEFEHFVNMTMSSM